MVPVEDSDARCINAIELTARFVLTCFLPLAVLLFVVCLLFEKGYKLGVNAGLLIALVYFVASYRCYGRSDKFSLVIAGQAGLTQANSIAAVHRAQGVDENLAFNPATGLMMVGDFDTMGNSYGFGITSDDTPGWDSPPDDYNHHAINPASGLPMVDDVLDVHGNVFGSLSADESASYGSFGADDSLALSAFDDAFYNRLLDDDPSR